MYKCEILADSLSPQNHRLTTFKVTYPRIIHAEMCRHRMLSRNSASSRAIPFEKMLKMVEEDPFIPIAWQKDHKGMQGTKYHEDKLNIEAKIDEWLIARNHMINQAIQLKSMDTTKQLCNRLLEPFLWHTELITGTEWDNFFDLRCPKYRTSIGTFRSKKDCINNVNEEPANNPNIPEYNNEMGWLKINESQAEIHIQAIAEMMWNCYNESIPKKLKAGDYHIPYGDNITIENLRTHKGEELMEFTDWHKVKIATSRCARISYETLGDNPKIDYEADIKLHDRLLAEKHMSPMEHCARAMSDEEYYNCINGQVCTKIVNSFTERRSETIDKNSETFGWCRNYRGWVSYRSLINK